MAKFLANENMPGEVVEAARAAGHDPLSDYLPFIIGGVILAILPAILVLGFRRLLKHKKALRRGWKAVEEGNLAGAHALFKDTANANLSFFVGLGKEPFDEAVQGLAEVYQKTGMAVDLDPVRQIRRAIRALEKGSTKTVGEKRTSAGKLGDLVHGVKAAWSIEKLVKEGQALIASLPTPER
jgi:hypothetical protein